MKLDRTTCDKPDRDVPKLVCGYPLPCPHHTIVVRGMRAAVDLVELVAGDADRIVRAMKTARRARARRPASTPEAT